MLWAVAGRGFMPACEPHTSIPIKDYNATQLIFTLENLGHNLPHFLSDRRWREEMVWELRNSAPLYAHNAVDNLGDPPEIERAFLLLTLFANAYVYALHEQPLKRVPKEISVPIARAAFLCGRQPLVNYTSYVLYNWSDNRVVNTFTNTDSESNIIEAFARTEIDFAEVLNSGDHQVLERFLETTLERFRNLRSQVKDFNSYGDLYGDFDNVFYEGWQHKPISYECNVFAQATFMSALYRLTDTLDKDPLLQNSEAAISIYRPAAHNHYIAGLKPLCSSGNCVRLFKDLHNEMFMIRDEAVWRIPRIKALDKTRLGV